MVGLRCGESSLSHTLSCATYTHTHSHCKINLSFSLSPQELIGKQPQQEAASKRAYLSNVCVAKAARRQGVAQALMERAEQQAKEEGVEHLYVHVVSWPHASPPLLSPLSCLRLDSQGEGFVQALTPAQVHDNGPPATELYVCSWRLIHSSLDPLSTTPLWRRSTITAPLRLSFMYALGV